MVIKDPINETRRLELIKLLDPDAEQLLADPVDFTFVEVVFIHELEDELLLPFRAGPGVPVGGVTIGMAISVGGAGGSAYGRLVAVGTTILAIPLIRDEPSVLDFLINALLERLIEAGAFGFDFVDIANLGLDADGELVARIPRQAEAFRVVGDQFKCHNFSFQLVVFGHKKARPWWPGGLVRVGDLGGGFFRGLVGGCSTERDDLGRFLADPVQRFLHKPVVKNRHGDPQTLRCKIQPLDQIPPQSR
jgi:hypothetical protein